MSLDLNKLLPSMITRGEHVVCAVSGGKDSMSLLHSLWNSREKYGITVSAAHFNHCLRVEESDRDAQFVKRYCVEQGIPIAMGSGDTSAFAAAEGMSIEDAARTLRYRFLLETAGNGKLATAHTAEDNLETMLMRIVRGCDLHGLSAIPLVRGNIIRPLLLCSRADIAEYIELHQIPYVEDSTNGTDECLRNRVRHHVLPLLMQENPSLPLSASALCLRLGEEDAYLAAEAERLLMQLQAHDGSLSCQSLLRLPEAISRRMLRIYLQEVPQLSSVQISDALLLCQNASPSAEIHLCGGYILRRRYDTILLSDPKVQSEIAAEIPALSLPESGIVQFGRYKISVVRGLRPQSMPSGVIALPYAEDYFLRVRRAGDTITLSGGTKKVSRVMIDRKLPAVDRQNIPMVCRADTIYAILPVVHASLASVAAGEDCLLLKCEEKSS